jgi:hypothetical protein
MGELLNMALLPNTAPVSNTAPEFSMALVRFPRTEQLLFMVPPPMEMHQ